MSNRQFSSHSIRLGTRLLAASTAVSGALILTGCDGVHTEGGVYRNAQECVAAQVFTSTYCADNFKKAQDEHTRLAPHYQTKKDCEKDWSEGQCDQYQDAGATGSYGGGHGSSVVVINSSTHGGGGYYAPRMGGYWTGYTETPSKVKDAPATKQPFSYPVYKAKDGTIYSPATNQTPESFGRTFENPDFIMAHSVETAPRPVFGPGMSFSEGGGAISRGGFGVTARGFGFGVGE